MSPDPRGCSCRVPPRVLLPPAACHRAVPPPHVPPTPRVSLPRDPTVSFQPLRGTTVLCPPLSATPHGCHCTVCPPPRLLPWGTTTMWPPGLTCPHNVPPTSHPCVVSPHRPPLPPTPPVFPSIPPQLCGVAAAPQVTPVSSTPPCGVTSLCPSCPPTPVTCHPPSLGLSPPCTLPTPLPAASPRVSPTSVPCLSPRGAPRPPHDMSAQCSVCPPFPISSMTVGNTNVTAVPCGTGTTPNGTRVTHRGHWGWQFPWGSHCPCARMMSPNTIMEGGMPAAFVVPTLLSQSCVG